MARPLNYPGADQSRRYDAKYPGITQPTVSKLVLHSTETAKEWGCPGYNGGAYAPTLTVCPWTKRRWQHFPATESARALLNPSSTAVSENRDDVAQVEIIGYSDANTAAKYGSDLREMGDDEYAFIAETIAWFVTEHDVPNRHPALWPSYPASYGNSSARMSSAEYDRFTGWLAHLHVSGNAHGDITLDAPRLKRAVDAQLGRDGGAQSVDFDVPDLGSGSGGGFVPVWTPTGKLNVKQIQRIVNVTADGLYGVGTKAAVAEYQRDLGVAADGLWGKGTEAAHNRRKRGAKVPRRLLKRGSKGRRVRRLQRGLNRVFPAYSSLAVDGDYGPATQKVVREFQRRSGLAVDGIVGKRTRAALAKVGIKA